MTLRSPVPGAPPKLRSTNSVPPPQAASSQCKLNLHFIYDAVWNRPHSVLLMFNRGVALNVFCFRFFLWLTFPFGEKKNTRADAKVRGRLVRSSRGFPGDDDDDLLGAVLWCTFWFDQYYRTGIGQQRRAQVWIPVPRISWLDSRSFYFERSIVASALFWFFFGFR